MSSLKTSIRCGSVNKDGRKHSLGKHKCRPHAHVCWAGLESQAHKQAHSVRPRQFAFAFDVADDPRAVPSLKQLPQTMLWAEALTDTKLLAWFHGWAVLGTGALLSITQCDTCVAKAWFLAAVMLWTSWRWRFKVTEWRLGKLQWGEDTPGPNSAEQPQRPQVTQQSLSVCPGQDGFQKHGISTDYAVSVQTEATHGSKALQRGVSSLPCSVCVSVRGRPPGRLVHLLPSFLQHLARAAAARIAVEDLAGVSVRGFRHSHCEQCAKGQALLSRGVLAGLLASSGVLVAWWVSLGKSISVGLALVHVCAVASAWLAAQKYLHRRVVAVLGY
ncbi:hypothetical protein DUNSADRAFT_13234 [Dunaliella salina]|uniref:Uncharacterized protein n=1 Tax=Dunaliella salina TaxID=3046 RepID=A0ABQ7H3J5_DUNSA|nr:hypothetical protein DUNSADRAFT_13234 [Dunaliella salina]|eukprot:KAF5841366.1 hypothetical protein DUNSADRAFT_13234 [Dunaliella salina]